MRAVIRFDSRGRTPTLLAAMLGLMAAWPVQAQYFTSTGANSSYPTNLFPIDPNAPILDFGINTAGIGNSAPGSFSALAGSLLKAGGLQIGNGGNGNGSVVVTGSGATVQLGATTSNRLDVGSWGTGTLTVSGGGVVDATVNAGNCSAGSFCNSFVGNAAGSMATLNISGAGSAVRTLNLGVGQSSVFTQAHDGFNFGTPGGTTNAYVNITNGGSLRSQTVTAGAGPTTGASLGTEKGFATIVIDGIGSQWIATRNTVTNAAAFFGVGSGIGGNATVDVRNGGNLTVDGTGGSATTFDVMNIGVNGGVGRVSVSGTGSSLVIRGNNPVLQVGRSGATGDGSLNVLAGATASALTVNVGRDSATGTLVIDGAGSQLNLVGVATPGVGGAAGAALGRTGGNGHATVSNGGRWLISDGGADSRSPYSTIYNGSPYLEVGRDSGSTGTLTITGAGSTVQLLATTLGPAPGVADNYDPYMAVGRYAGATGLLTVSGGGKLLLQGDAVSNVANSRATVLNIGGSNDVDAGGHGTALVSGQGSEIRLSGSDTFIAVGRGAGAVGQLTIADGAVVSTINMGVGRAGGTGTLVLDNSLLNLSGQQTGNNLAGANLSIGQSGGVGTVVIGNGSQLNITNLGSAGASLNLGGTGNFPRGNGTLALSGASQINLVAASGLATITVGRDGTGTMTATQGSSINVGDGSVYIGRLAGSNGSLQLSNSTLNAGFVGVGQSQTAVGGTAELVLDNSTVNTTALYIGAGGTLSGDNGVINATGDVTVAGTISPGHSPSRVNINCNFVTLAGSRLILDVLDVNGGFDVDHLILGNDSTFDLSQIQLVFNFLGNTDPNAFAASGGFDLDNFIESMNLQTGVVSGLSSVFAPGTTWSDIFRSSQFTAVSSAYDVTNLRLTADGTVTFTAAPVPEPGTWALMLFGLALLGFVARRRR